MCRCRAPGEITLHAEGVHQPSPSDILSGGWDLVTDAIDNRALRGCFENARRVRIHTCVQPVAARGCYYVYQGGTSVAPHIVMQARKCHRRESSRTGPIARPESCREFQRKRERERERKGKDGTLLSIQRVTVPSGCNIVLRRDCREFKVARYPPRG